MFNVVKCTLTLLSTVYKNDWLKLTFNCFFAIQPGEYYFQLTNYLTWFAFITTFFLQSWKNKYVWNKIKETTFANIDLFYFSNFIFKKITISFKKVTFQKKMLVQEKLDYIDIDDIGNIVDSPKLVFTDEECGNLIVVHINQKKKSRRFTIAYRCPLSERCCRREYLFSSHVKYLLWIS